MNHISFGSVLKEARIRKGYELASVARRLRIRTDILQAIENSDFSNMPPSGYTRNMINAYARLLGVDNNEITRMYLDEAYAYRVGRAYKEKESNRSRYSDYNTSNTTSRPSSARRQDNQDTIASRRANTASTTGVNSFGRMVYSSRDELAMRNGQAQTQQRATQHSSQRSSQRTNNTAQVHRSRRPAITEGKYGNLVSSAPANYTKHSKLPFIIAGIVLLLIIIIFSVVSCSNNSNEQQNIPVTGVETKKEAEQTTKTETAPTEFSFTYEIADGSSSWIEVYIGDEQQEAGEVTGPATKEYKFTSDLKFVSGSVDGVKVTVAGEAQEILAGDNGVVSETYSFEDLLNKWYEAHPNVKKPTSTTSSSTSSNTSSNSTTSSSSTSSSSSTTSNNSTTTSSTSSN